MKKIFGLLFLLLVCAGCYTEDITSSRLYIENHSSHNISITSSYLGSENYVVAPGSSECISQVTGSGLSLFILQIAEVTFDDELIVAYDSKSDLTEYNICLEENWKYEEDGHMQKWTYTFTDEDFSYAKSLN